MFTCKTCGATLDLTMSCCPSCGAQVPMGRLTGMFGLVCRRCDAYNDPSAKTCVACGDSLLAEDEGRPTPAALVSAQAHPTAVLESSPAAASPPDLAAGVPPTAAPGSRPISARLVVERGEAAPGTTFRLAEEETPAGSAKGQVAFPDDRFLAPLHATFVVREGALVLRDEGAAGGVYVRVSGATVPLRPGSFFAVGDRLLRFGGPLPPPPPPAADGTRRVGAPRPERTAVLVEEWLEGGVGGRAYVRSGPSITVGRSGCTIDLGEDPSVAQAHAEILVQAEGSARLRDLGSPDGTFLRLPPRSERELHDGDSVRLGREVLRVEVGP